VRIAGTLLDELIAHALEDPENEVCGLIAVEPGPPARAVRLHRAINKHASPLRFEIEAQEQFKLYRTIEQEDLEVGALYHSHVRSKPYPSQTDIAFAANLSDLEWVIVGLAGDAEPEVRSYLIEDGQVREVALEVDSL
jgi:[CysO sulfur-carrier protein]-S-L-cysteine hydrolase